MEPKIFTYIDEVQAAYSEPVERMNGLTHNHKDIIRTVEFYSDSKYLSGNRDALGREKPFYNVGNYRVTTAKVGTDLDLKDMRYEADSLKFSVQTMMINKELFKDLKEIQFSETLNDSGLTRPKYGGVLNKKYEKGKELRIDVIEWKNVEVDPVDILGGTIIETHYMTTSQFSKMDDVYKDVPEVLKAHAKANKNRPARIEIKEITGDFPLSYIPDEEHSEADEYKYQTMCFYVAVIKKKKYLLHREDLKSIEDKYMYCPWEKVPGVGLGRGVWQESFEGQWATNDFIISMKNSIELTGKVLLATDSSKVSGNAISGVDNGHIFQMSKGDTLTQLNLAPGSFPQYQQLFQLWDDQLNKGTSVYGSNTGEAPTAGTPYSQTALLNQVANSPFEYQREVAGIYFGKMLNSWILPFVKKRIKKDHNLVAEYTDEELDVIDEAIANFKGNEILINSVLEGAMPSPEDYSGLKDGIKQKLGKTGKKRELRIPEGFLDVEGSITANITGELKNKQAILQSLDGVLKTIVSTFNPNTGTYAALEDPVLSKIFGSIVELSGIPISSAMMKPSKTSPTQGADLSAIAPQNAGAPK